MKQKNIILASGSPRRRELLAQAGFSFTVSVADIDEEAFPQQLPIEQIPAYLANEKALKIQSIRNTKDDIILAADSLVFLDNTVYTKPKDRNDAIDILQSLSGKSHTVITGVCIRYNEYIDSQSVYTEVCFDTFSLNEIEYYIDNFKPYDKAGAYGIQDWIGLCKVRKIIGSYTNIMGLPVETVYTMLSKIIQS